VLSVWGADARVRDRLDGLGAACVAAAAELGTLLR
jgi:hypothetical protein